jgi:NADH-quinone oxidoreductase subunit J
MTLPIPDLGTLLFLGIFMIICASAIMVVTSPNLVHSAVSLLFTLFGVAAVYVFLYADFIAATQVVVYVGGILVLIIFGVMLTNKIENATIDSKTHNRIPGLVFSLILLIIQFYIIFNTNWYVNDNMPKDSTIKDIGNMLLNKYLLPFEVVSILLLAALIGAAMLSRKKEA